MGGYDALVEYNECAVKQFILKWEQASKTGQKYTDFIRNQSAEVGIHLGYINTAQYRQDVYRWYLIHPYGCLENTVKDLKEDLKAFSFDINLDYSDRNVLERLILGLRAEKIPISVDGFKLDLDKYYHRCRNLFAHKLGEKEEEKINSLFKKIPKDKVLDFYPSLTDALSDPGILTFDDYTLCSANLKNIIDILITDVYSVIDWKKFRIEQTKCMSVFKRFEQNPARLLKYIKHYISSTYGVEITEDELQILRDRLIQSNNG